MTEMLAFTKRPGETINELLARYETVRQRAAVEGQFVMSIEGCCLQILRAIGIQAQHLFPLLQPFGGQLPQNEQQFGELCTQLRRYGHISEQSRGNVASVLHGPLRQARSGTYLTAHDHQAYQQAAQQTALQGRGTMASFFGQERPTGEGPWAHLTPQPLMDLLGAGSSYWSAGGGQCTEAGECTMDGHFGVSG